MLRSQKRLLGLLGVLILLLIAVAFLYMVGMSYLEERPRGFLQSLEWAAETLSTTGYGADTSWRNPVMVLFVISLQLLGVFLIFLVFPVYVIPFFEERFEARLPRTSPEVQDHVVIFRHGPAVATLLEELEEAKITTVVAEEREAEARRLVELGHCVAYGSLDDGVLNRVHLDRARALIVNSTDDANAEATLSARQLGFEGEILALVEEPLHRTPITLAGATAVYTPRHILGAALAARASRRVSPTVAGIQQLGNKLQVSEARIARGSVLEGKTLAEAGLGRQAGVTVIGQWIGGKLMAPVDTNARLNPGGILILVGTAESIQGAIDVCHGAIHLRRRGPFLVAGNGEVGRKVVEILNDAGETTRVLDCKAGEGVHVVGNVLDPRILEKADVGNTQAVILALSADTPTLFATVILRDVAPDIPVIARVNRAENVERIYGAGADFALSISQVAGQILASRLLRKEAITVDPQLKVLKVSAHGLEGRHLAALGIRNRTGCSVIAVERGDNLLVEFDVRFRFEAGDTIYVCGSIEATQKYGKVFPQG